MFDNPIMKHRQKYIMFFIFLFIVFLIVSFFIDKPLFSFLKNNINLEWMFFLETFSDFTLLILLVILITIFFFSSKRREHKIIPLWLSFIIAVSVAYLLKFLIARPRPMGTEYIFGLINYSFPSAHMAAYFAVFTFLWVEYKRWRWLWIFIGAFFFVNRLFTHSHYLSDLVFGIFIGKMTYLFVNFYYKKEIQHIEKVFHYKHKVHHHSRH